MTREYCLFDWSCAIHEADEKCKWGEIHLDKDLSASEGGSREMKVYNVAKIWQSSGLYMSTSGNPTTVDT